MTAQLSFEDLAEQVAALPATGVQVDRRYGHIRVGDLVLADLHSVLSVWSYGGHDLTPDEAHALAQALTAWADRTPSRVSRDDGHTPEAR